VARPSSIPQEKTNFTLRTTCLHWINQTLDIIGLQDKTHEMVLILTDLILEVVTIDDKDLETFCVSCILLVLKLETDLNPNIIKFLEYVTTEMHLSPSDLKQMEVFLLKNLPWYFVLIVPLSEIIHSLCHKLGSASQCYKQVVQTDYRLFIHTFVQRKLTYKEFDSLLNRLVASVTRSQKQTDCFYKFDLMLAQHEDCPTGSLCALYVPLNPKFTLSSSPTTRHN